MPSGKEGYLEGSLKVGTAPVTICFYSLASNYKTQAILARSALIAVKEQFYL
jgi:hypothetical protein